ncbi:gliding motility-associated peptidyl-prolyl isomerase GldI [Lutimonas saemankumensis]|uniref:gliding motility-associated peptidyl-prolyl isomerase GldI n=1 Tax=Lutimonas saemankumensis TaxID=483016 RepID=UPI001CD74179|nr:gliding motility-associated peptidyl-prolyl isomerase GldI [Lutimonas saemankumensis]MCA0932079.1 gliding motility-associated peptidyl-prolyl isomerase GldI [Lutimonas saemankumensis]
MKNYLLIIFLGIVMTSCSDSKARKPIVRKTSSFMSESIERNKLLNKAEQTVLIQKMESDSLNQYLNSEHGFWYYYEKQNPDETIFPSSGDEVFYTHEIKNLDGSILYSMEELGTRSYLIDKEELISGLQDGFKIMKEGEVITFLFPSYKAYGYLGNDRIEPNQPLIYTVELLKINKLSENENNE